MRGGSLRAQRGPPGHPGRTLRAEPRDQGRQGDPEGAEAAEADLRDGNHRALPALGELGGGGADRDVPRRHLGAPGRGHHRSLVGHAGEPEHGLEPEQEDLRQDRGVAAPPDRERAPLLVPRRHCYEADMGRRGAQRLAPGGDRCDLGGLPRDPRHLRGRQGGQVRLVSLPAPHGRPRAQGRRADRLRRLQGPGRERRRVPAGGPLATLCRGAVEKPAHP